MSVSADQVLDCSGLACPMPIIKTRKAIDGLQVGQVLKMIATDALKARLAGLPAQLLTPQRISDAIEAAIPAAKAVSASVPR